MPMSMVGSSRANRISCSRSPRRIPVKTMETSRPGSKLYSGTRQSRVVDLDKGTWFDFEAGAGGGDRSRHARAKLFEGGRRELAERTVYSAWMPVRSRRRPVGQT